MTDAPAQAPLTPPNYLRFLGVVIAVKLALVAIFYVLTFFGLNLSTSSTHVVAPMLAAMIEGQFFAKANGAKPPSGLSWRFSILAAILAIVIEMLLAAALFSLVPQVAKSVGSMPAAHLVGGGIFAFYFVAFVLTHRIFFPMGARNMLNAEAAKAKRAAARGGKS